ncbi:hypothetical protein FRC00_003254 [Tulasnella sp. 408]|nr:hypothetical protein FRC00_003254 [Tulasnella sp. 408]
MIELSPEHLVLYDESDPLTFLAKELPQFWHGVGVIQLLRGDGGWAYLEGEVDKVLLVLEELLDDEGLDDEGLDEDKDEDEAVEDKDETVENDEDAVEDVELEDEVEELEDCVLEVLLEAKSVLEVEELDCVFDVVLRLHKKDEGALSVAELDVDKDEDEDVVFAALLEDVALELSKEEVEELVDWKSEVGDVVEAAEEDKTLVKPGSLVTNLAEEIVEVLEEVESLAEPVFWVIDAEVLDEKMKLEVDESDVGDKDELELELKELDDEDVVISTVAVEATW